jgi:hypothetical protein
LRLQVWGSKKFELQPATSAARSHGVFHDRIKTLYSVFESSKKGMDLQMTACVCGPVNCMRSVLMVFCLTMWIQVPARCQCGYCRGRAAALPWRRCVCSNDRTLWLHQVFVPLPSCVAHMMFKVAAVLWRCVVMAA